MQPKVSVIIPVYNTEKYLRQCLDSVVNQTLKEIEIICIDDGSTDNSLKILEEYEAKDERFVILKQVNKGAGVARNLGIDCACGEYIFFMDSDDYCDLKLFDKTIKYAEMESLDIVVFDFCRFNDNTQGRTDYKGLVKDRLPFKSKVFSHKDIPENICNTINPTPWNKIFRKDFVVKNHLRYLALPTTNDITFATISVIMADKIGYYEDVFYYYRTGLSGAITSRKRDNLDDIIEAVLSVDRQSKRLPYYDDIKKSIGNFIINNLFTALERYAGDSFSAKYIEYENKINSIFMSYHLFVDIERYRDNIKYKEIIERRKKAFEICDFRYALPVIVSLTSFPERIRSVYKTISSLYLQTHKVEKILLYLSVEQFPNLEKDLPIELLEYKEYGLVIKWVDDNIKPHKKYVYAMQEYDDSLIITVDDDLYYDNNMVKELFLSYLKHPNAISATRTHLITFDENKRIASYENWIKEYSGFIDIPMMSLFATSGAGTLFPPHCMDKEVFNTDLIKKLCLNADDLWLKVMSALNNTPVVLVRENRKLNYIPGTQEIALQDMNVYGHQNDIQLNNILEWCSEKRNIEISSLMKDECANHRNINKKENRQAEGIGFCYAWMKIKGGIQCFKEHGMVYTIKRTKMKLYNTYRRFFV